MTTVDEILEHHGIKGMRWGVEKSRISGASETHVIGRSEHTDTTPLPTHTEEGAKIKYVHEHAAAKSETDRIIKEHGIQAVSNYQLRSANERSDLEGRYKTLNPTTVSKGSRFVKDLVGQTAKQQTGAAVNRQIAKSLAKKAVVAAVVA